MQGPTSSGKTSLVSYLAAQTGHTFVRINNHEQTDLQEYLGSYVSDESGRLVFREGLLVQAVRRGWWIVLDELNLAPTEVLEALNRCGGRGGSGRPPLGNGVGRSGSSRLQDAAPASPLSVCMLLELVVHSPLGVAHQGHLPAPTPATHTRTTTPHTHERTRARTVQAAGRQPRAVRAGAAGGGEAPPPLHALRHPEPARHLRRPQDAQQVPPPARILLPQPLGGRASGCPAAWHVGGASAPALAYIVAPPPAPPGPPPPRIHTNTSLPHPLPPTPHTQLRRAFRSRFLELHVDDIPDSELTTILEKRWGYDSQRTPWLASPVKPGSSIVLGGAVAG
jgi:hypothetical protein